MRFCCSKTPAAMFLLCSGSSNVGQAANQVAVELTCEGHGKMFCPAGIGAQMQEFIRSVHDPDRVVVIDGCPVGCARKIMENSQVSGWECIILSDIGIEKLNHNSLPLPVSQAEQEKAAILALHQNSQEKTVCCA